MIRTTTISCIWISAFRPPGDVDVLLPAVAARQYEDITAAHIN
jgi:hypothetical protein